MSKGFGAKKLPISLFPEKKLFETREPTKNTRSHSISKGLAHSHRFPCDSLVMPNRKTNQTREISVERSQQKNTVNQSNVFVCFSREKNRKKRQSWKTPIAKMSGVSQSVTVHQRCAHDAHLCSRPPLLSHSWDNATIFSPLRLKKRTHKEKTKQKTHDKESESTHAQKKSRGNE